MKVTRENYEQRLVPLFCQDEGKRELATFCRKIKGFPQLVEKLERLVNLNRAAVSSWFFFFPFLSLVPQEFSRVSLCQNLVEGLATRNLSVSYFPPNSHSKLMEKIVFPNEFDLRFPFSLA